MLDPYDAPIVYSRDGLIAACIAQAIPGGLYLEFGVYEGAMTCMLRKLIDQFDPQITLYGFDSFQGLPDEWNGNPAGTFKTDKRIDLPNVELIEGMFADTLPGFLATNREHVSFMVIDCDLYQSTKDVFIALHDRIVPGTAIYFDELMGYYGWREHEYRALKEFVAAKGCGIEWIGRREPMNVGLRIL